MRFGIDIRGGIDAAFKPKDLDRAPTAAELESARAVIESRLDGENILDRVVTVDATNGYVFVQFPWKSDETTFDPGAAISELGSMAHLTFRDPTGAVVLEGNQVASATPAIDNSKVPIGYYVKLDLKDAGKTAFADATTRLIGQKISIYMDENQIDAPTVNSAITNGSCIIEGLPSYDYAANLARMINSGALPFALYADTYSAISPTLGSNALNIMLWAGLITFLLISLGLVLFYRVSGMIAIIALILQIGGLIFLLSVLQVTITLTGIAGVILSLGMGVDANIIIAERIRDALRKGKDIALAVAAGFKRAFTAILDGNLTTALAAIILAFLGSGTFKSFAYTLLIGLVMNFVGGVFASRLMTQSLTQIPAFRRTTMFMSDKVMQKELKVYRFCKQKRFAYMISGVLIIAGLIVTLVGGVRMDVQFTGGSIIKYSITTSADINTSEAASVASAALGGRPTGAQVTEDFSTKENSLVFTMADTQSISNENLLDLTSKLQETYPDYGLTLNDVKNVEPFLGRQALNNGLLSMLISLVTMIIYVWFRFRKIKSGLAVGVIAVMALIHDCIFAFLAFVVFRIPIGDAFTAVVLTTIGYSINATIIVFDRIRENAGAKNKLAAGELVNLSVSQTLARCINTTTSVLISMVIVFVLAAANGLESMTSFALPLIIAAASGCFSSVCLTSPSWALWMDSKQRRLNRQKGGGGARPSELRKTQSKVAVEELPESKADAEEDIAAQPIPEVDQADSQKTAPKKAPGSGKTSGGKKTSGSKKKPAGKKKSGGNKKGGKR